jgi:hypothetical protein
LSEVAPVPAFGTAFEDRSGATATFSVGFFAPLSQPETSDAAATATKHNIRM